MKVTTEDTPVQAKRITNGISRLGGKMQLMPKPPLTLPEPTPADAIADQATAVLAARRLHQSLKAKVDTSRKTWATDNAALLEAADHARTQVADREAHLRAMALTVYFETGNKAPTPGVGIRVTTKPTYYPDAALAWAKEHSIALQLDVKAFEAIAKHGTCGSIVTFSQEPTATISSDLAAALEVR